MYEGIISRENTLLSVVERYATKFDVTVMPAANVIILFIACYEMLYLATDPIPEKVSINEAIELAKKFSDDPARALINGVLNRVREDINALRTEVFATREHQFFT